jgi:hypothetical protein
VGNPKAACVSYHLFLSEADATRLLGGSEPRRAACSLLLRKKDSKDNQMRNFTLFIAGLTITAVVSFSLDAVAGSKKCKKGLTYSESSGKCIRKGGYRY